MFTLLEPTAAQVERFLMDAADSSFSYPEVGATRTAAPSGYNVDSNRREIGRGTADFELAKQAVRRWQMYRISWVEVFPHDQSIEPGRIVAIQVRHLGFFSLNAARIVYTIDEPSRFGFAYGTLSEHAEAGEERFLVEMDPNDQTVSYDLLAFSRPNNLAAKIGYPIARMLQKRFAADSLTAMAATVERLRTAA